MKELDRSEARKGSSIGTELRTELTDVEPDPSISMRSWGGEVKGEDRWRIELPTTKPGAPSPYDQFDMLEKSRPTLHGLHHLHRASRRVFSCFRHSSINLVCPCLLILFCVITETSSVLVRGMERKVGWLGLLRTHADEVQYPLFRSHLFWSLLLLLEE